MSRIKNISGGIFLTCVIFIFICFGSARTAEDVSTSDRIERAILRGGFSSRQDIVGGGAPGKDFPVLNSIPKTDFSCQGRSPGFYADEEHGCQVFHRCHSDRRKDSFLCPNGTIFHQLRLVCDWWYNVDCASSDLHVSVNNEIGRVLPKSKDQQFTSERRTSFTSVSNFAQKQETLPSPSVDLRHPQRVSSGNIFGVPLHGISNIKKENVDNRNIRVSKPTLNPKIHFSSSIPDSSRRTNNIPSNVTPRTGVALPALSRSNLSLLPVTRTSFNKQRNDIQSAPGLPLPKSTDNEAFPPVTTFAPRLPIRLSLPRPEKTGVPLPTSNSINRNTQKNDLGRTSLTGRRVTVNKRPVTSLSSDGRKKDSFTSEVSLPHFRAPHSQKLIRGNKVPEKQIGRSRKQELTSSDAIIEQGVAILNDKKITTQFFNIGAPRVVSSRRPVTSKVGIPLSAASPQSARRNRIRNNNQRGQDPLPPSTISFQSDRINTVKNNNVGRPLPAISVQLPRRGDEQINRGRPLPALDHQSGRDGAVRNSVVNSIQGTSRNVNRGTTTFKSSLDNRGAVNRLLNNRNRGSVTSVVRPVGFVRVDLDDLLDTDERTDDPFDDDRFDLHDRFDDIDDHFDDRFDGDRFDDDRFDLDRFDDDRFDLDDRFDNDPFDDDRFKFDDDDDFDDRLNRFDSAVSFNFDRRARGNTFPSSTGSEVPSKIEKVNVPIKPPPEIQLPPPPL